LFQIPSQVNPDISPRVERALLHAISMHPDERPSSIAEFRDELFSSKPLNNLAADHMNAEQVSQWRKAIRENGVLFLATIVLLVIALVATALSPYLSPTPVTLPPL
jgi:serine/threonine-protein kinase